MIIQDKALTDHEKTLTLLMRRFNTMKARLDCMAMDTSRRRRLEDQIVTLSAEIEAEEKYIEKRQKELFDETYKTEV